MDKDPRDKWVAQDKYKVGQSRFTAVLTESNSIKSNIRINSVFHISQL